MSGMRSNKQYTCKKCSAVKSSYDIFGVGWPDEKFYCRSYTCIPKMVQLKMWFREPTKGELKFIVKNWFK